MARAPQKKGVQQFDPRDARVVFERLKARMILRVDSRPHKCRASSCSPFFRAKGDRWDLNPRSSGLAATSVGARCPILVVLASRVAVRKRSRLRSLVVG